VTKGHIEQVKDACDLFEISYPILERDLAYSAISFEINGEWHLIEGARTNRNERFFFKLRFGHFSLQTPHEITNNTLEEASSFFAENWDDVENPMLNALRKSTRVKLHRK
jgi:hypothetical protein